MRYGRLGFWYRLVVVVVEPVLRLTTTRDWRGQEHIPADGGFILAANHISYVDPMTLGLYVLDAGRTPEVPREVLAVREAADQARRSSGPSRSRSIAAPRTPRNALTAAVEARAGGASAY